MCIRDSHKFAQKSVLRFQTYVYNAVVGESTPEIWVEARVLRGRERVLTLPGSRVPMGASGDLKRLPYWSEISLLQLPPGNYTPVSYTHLTLPTSDLV